ncbi:TPA: hypothetical protein ACH3X3_004028 [Trebouxia sp. C0006]
MRLSLQNLHVNELPAWFSNLQRLQELEMNYARFQAFPASLSALEHLEMLGLHAYFTENVVDLAALPKLTSLAFGEVLREPDLSYDPIEFYKALRHRPAAGVWDDSMLLTDNKQHFRIEGPPSVFLDLALANSQLAERITAVG